MWSGRVGSSVRGIMSPSCTGTGRKKKLGSRSFRLLNRWTKSRTHVAICLLKDANNISLHVTSNFCLIIMNCETCGQKQSWVFWDTTESLFYLTNIYVKLHSAIPKRVRAAAKWAEVHTIIIGPEEMEKKYWSDKIMSFCSNLLGRCEERPSL